MTPQPLHDAITTEQLDCLGLSPEEPKSGFADLMACASQVGTALTLCWMLHLFV